jgi:hypothetical protein
MSVREIVAKGKLSRLWLWATKPLYSHRNLDAITIGETIFYFSDDARQDQTIRRHEYRHVQQMRALRLRWPHWMWIGTLRWGIKYWWDSMLHGYDNNKLEADAYAVQDDPSGPTADNG